MKMEHPPSPLVTIGDDTMQAQDALVTNHETVQTGPAEFTLFPKLPIELRLVIWRHAAQLKRILRVEPGYMMMSNYRAYSLEWHIVSQPGALLASKEAHDEMMRSYTKFSCGHAKPTLINFEADVLHFESQRLFYWFSNPNPWRGGAEDNCLHNVPIHLAIGRRNPISWSLLEKLLDDHKSRQSLILEDAEDGRGQAGKMSLVINSAVSTPHGHIYQAGPFRTTLYKPLNATWVSPEKWASMWA